MLTLPIPLPDPCRNVAPAIAPPTVRQDCDQLQANESRLPLRVKMRMLGRNIVIPSFHRQRALIVGWFSVCLHGDRDTEKITALAAVLFRRQRVFEGVSRVKGCAVIVPRMRLTSR